MQDQTIDEIDFDKLHKMQKFKNVYDSIPKVLGPIID